VILLFLPPSWFACPNPLAVFKIMKNKLIIKFKKLNSSAVIPTYGHPGDAAMDLYSNQNVIIKPKQYKIIKLGLASIIPKNWFASIRDRSGLAANHGLHVHAGVIDSGYRGEWAVILINHGTKTYNIRKGDRIAQAIISPAPHVEIKQVKNLNSSKRSTKGFGSTGK
jgi:dUTP pyrophosphatase